jgi:hypothetical protein
MIKVIEHEGYLDIYSDAGKKILEVTDGSLWNTDEKNHIAVDKQRYYNGDYIETDEDVEFEETEEKLD